MSCIGWQNRQPTKPCLNGKGPGMSISYAKLPRDILRVSGSDQRSFLQGLISQDVDKVSPSLSAYGTLLTPQGKYLHDFIMAQQDETLLFDCERGRGDDLVTRLSRFKLRADVQLAHLKDHTVFAVFGRGAADALDLDAGEGATSTHGIVVALVDPRTAALGCRLIGPAADIEALLKDRNIPESDLAAYDQLRISLQVPDGSRDLEIEKSILLESNIDVLNGIDWEKGCYMGQELTARTKYRGLVKRGLIAFRSDAIAAQPGDPILAGDKVIGEVRSTSKDLLLASVRLDALEDSATTLTTGGETLQRLT